MKLQFALTLPVSVILGIGGVAIAIPKLCTSTQTLTPPLGPIGLTPAKQANLANWIGTYTFSEVLERNNGVPMVWAYQIIIFREGENYAADINIDGFQTAKRLTCDVKPTQKNKIGLYFHRYREGYLLPGGDKRGDLLLELEQSTSSRLRVILGSLQPLLPEHRGVFVPTDLKVQ
jgi:hypothetical protein